MEHTHQYDCIVCGAHFDSSEDLTIHNEGMHLSKATGMERPRKNHGDPLGDAAPSRERAPNHEQDRNPRQGFVDPRSDKSSAT